MYEPDEERPLRIPVPFLAREVRAGDAVASATKAVGIRPCAPCEQRRRWLNQRLRFVPPKRRR